MENKGLLFWRSYVSIELASNTHLTRDSMSTQATTPTYIPSHGTDVNESFRGGPRSLAFLSDINEASIVMLAKVGVFNDSITSRIAKGVLQLAGEIDPLNSTGTGNYLDYEKRLEKLIGEDASLVHAGRSRQDIASTLSRMNLRDDLLNAHHALAQARFDIVRLALSHQETVIPAYTHGVQAQPTTFAHYLLAQASALGRLLDRLAQAYARLNLCPLGVAALSTSSFPIDRLSLADLLGFDGVIENSYDANHLAPVDSCLEFASILSMAAVQISQFAQDLHAQYAAPIPWLTLAPGELMGVSSLMPQKRNPAALEQLRAQSSLLLSDMQGPFMLAHNVRTGMFDYRAYDPLPTTRPVRLFSLLQKVINSIVVDTEQARTEVDADYSTITEVADMLLQKANVPFRVGHHFASAIVDFGRSQKIRLQDISYSDAANLYKENNKTAFPLTEEDWKKCADPVQMIFNRKGYGGPQLSEIQRMQIDESDSAARALKWNQDCRAHLDRVKEIRIAAVKALIKNT